ncbi:hypothetical protein KJ632_05215 [Patescibacteria group bacterium]|nr:hypothetical protein [Patescibacteria group bacterium]
MENMGGGRENGELLWEKFPGVVLGAREDFLHCCKTYALAFASKREAGKCENGDVARYFIVRAAEIVMNYRYYFQTNGYYWMSAYANFSEGPKILTDLIANMEVLENEVVGRPRDELSDEYCVGRMKTLLDDIDRVILGFERLVNFLKERESE